jgi:uncharacterized coiled-coil protein SlyX
MELLQQSITRSDTPKKSLLNAVRDKLKSWKNKAVQKKPGETSPPGKEEKIKNGGDYIF